MKISISATNPCHLHPLASGLADLNALGCYHSGYPTWKLPPESALPTRTHSFRTTLVYGMLKLLPAKFRPGSRALFLWQDHGFDRAVARNLESCNFLHAMPGQCLESFRAARRIGVQTVLNHATGPVREWVKIMEPEYARVGLRLSNVCPYDHAYFAREDEEYALAHWHCAASTIVRDQLISIGIPPAKIWVVPYGADSRIFHPPVNPAPRERFKIVFAGQAGLRKGIKTLLDALTIAARSDWQVDFYGARLEEAERDFADYRGATPVHFHGPVSQSALAEAFRTGSVLVLPSLEEGFGLVVPQALSCGMPCIVSDRVGGRDLVRHRENGSVFPALDPHALEEELSWWAADRPDVRESFPWSHPARTLLALSQASLA